MEKESYILGIDIGKIPEKGPNIPLTCTCDEFEKMCELDEESEEYQTIEKRCQERTLNNNK